MPKHVRTNKRSRAIWRQTVADLDALGVLSRSDGGVIGAYVTALDRWESAEQVIADMGFVAITPNGCPIVHPAVAVANKAIEQVNRLAQQLGLSPASRTRVAASRRDERDDDSPASLYFRKLEDTNQREAQ